jgi:WD40-like Beta Propeller Repeat
MKRCWTFLAVSAIALFVAAGCNDYGNTFQVPTGARLSSLSPSTVPAGNPGFTLTLNGAGFVAKTVVQWNGKTIPTQLQTDSQGNVIGISATVDASLVAQAGTAFVNTLSPHSGAGTNGLSNTLAFIINPPPSPVPAISSISPSCAVAGSASFTLSITGSNFLPTSDPSGGSQVHWNAGPTQSTLPISGSISATQIQATVDASLVAAAGSAVVTVYNPPTPQSVPPGSVGNPPSGGGGSSNGVTFTVSGSACPASATATAQNSVTQETPAVSGDGRYVAYSATQNEHTQVFVRDTCMGATTECQPRTSLLSVAQDGTPGNADSRSPSISADGRYVAFSSAASNLAESASAGRQIYLRDTCFGADQSCSPSTKLISTDGNGALVGTENILPSISGSGRFIAFVAVTPSHSTKSSPQNKAENAPNSGLRQVFVRDTCLGATDCTPKTIRISLTPGDASVTQTDSHPAGPAVSGSGKHVALPDIGLATVFTRGVAVDDRVFLALTHDHE